ncbi:PIN domain-containing protein [Candidatus Woesearchaeota archaeon]|nr:PIN domain-containing protein [Candidatus Woesearchaeota archaeon]
MGVEYFFDTYAVIEVMRKNPTHEKYIDARIRITFINLIEIAYITLIQQGLRAAQDAFHRFKEFIVEVSDNDVLEAIRFRAENKKKSLSYADCIGYVYAINHSLFFLTGDDAFKNLPNVEFRK